MLRKKPLNQNAIRSINLIVNSLFSLMNDKGFIDISITDITKNAGIVRNTFYAHFNRKEDVIFYYIVKLFKDKIEAEVNIEVDDYDTVLMYFELWYQNQDLLDLLEKNDLLYLISGIKDFITVLDISKYIYTYCVVSDKAKKYSNTFYVDALASIVKKWSITGKKETPLELAEIYREFIR